MMSTNDHRDTFDAAQASVAALEHGLTNPGRVYNGT